MVLHRPQKQLPMIDFISRWYLSGSFGGLGTHFWTDDDHYSYRTTTSCPLIAVIPAVEFLLIKETPLSNSVIQ